MVLRMNSAILPYRVFPLGDTAITIDFGNGIDEAINEKILVLFHHLSADPLPGMIEAVPAYSSLTVYYDLIKARRKIPLAKTVYEFIAEKLLERLQQPLPVNDNISRTISIPVCYEKEFAPDLVKLAGEKNIPADEVIRIHTSKSYRVYMLGFLPGFPYLGPIDERIVTSRKPQPATVAAGSVGIAGRQTGIYPQASPGGWQIIGRTPLKLFDTGKDEPTLLKAGDIVQFISISKDEFESY
jgi:inhibitor of KinA